MDTIFALSSGPAPAAIAIVRISGPAASRALEFLAGKLPEPRHASLRTLRDGGGRVLDEALVLWFPGPDTATGEDLAELHCHGGRAVVAAVETALGSIKGLRPALAGEFTRRAFANGRIDLAEAEGLADLLEAETELQRSAAMAMVGGGLSVRVEQWREGLLMLSAQVEAVLDFSGEDDAGELPQGFAARLTELAQDAGQWAARPQAEKLHEGFRVVIAGPPNAGKSTLFNALTDSEAAITSPHAGTTRDVIERNVGMDGIPFSFVDTAGLRDETRDEVEAIGIGRARDQLLRADCVLWLGPEGEGPGGAIEVEAQADRDGHASKVSPQFVVSALTGQGLGPLRNELISKAKATMPRAGEFALNHRQRGLVGEFSSALGQAGREHDLLLVAECLRRARLALDSLVGRVSTEDMLDALFGRFCIGK